MTSAERAKSGFADISASTPRGNSPDCSPATMVSEASGKHILRFEGDFISARTVCTGLLPTFSERTWFDVFGERGFFSKNRRVLL